MEILASKNNITGMEKVHFKSAFIMLISILGDIGLIR